MAVESENPKKSGHEDLLRIARERFKLSEEAEAEIRKTALEDLKFLAGDQWPEEIKNIRKLESRPCLTINRMPQHVRQVTNDQRQNKPSIKVNPVDDNADIETAKIYQGLIRNIEYDSNAGVAYDSALEGAAQKGFGFFRLTTDYVDPYSFDQKILIKPIFDHFKARLDPFSKELDGSDANWGFIEEFYSMDDYKAEFGETDLAKNDNWDALGVTVPGWVTDKGCRIVEYFYKDFKEIDLVLLSDGNSGPKEDLPEELPLNPDGSPIYVVAERKAKVPVVKHCVMNGIEILEETELPGKYIPIIPVYGAVLNIDGKVIRESVFRHAIDSQRQYNYFVTTETEAIALAPKAPFIMAEGQDEGYEYMWQTANTKNHSALKYKPTTHDNHLVPPPQRNSYEPPVGAITSARMQASEDIKTTTGQYDAAMGARSNETSGIAIQRRSAQAQTATYHFVDNLTTSLRHCGKILLEWIPYYYDSARAVRILGEEGDQEIVRINEEFERKGEKVRFDLGVGQYDVVVETGPSFATKRQEAAAALLEFTKALPQHAALISDLVAKNLDFPGAHEMAERLKKTLPPGIADDKDKKPIPPEVQQKLQQMDQMIAQLTADLSEAAEEIKLKKYELESKERIEAMKIERDIILAKAELEGAFGLETLKAEIADVNKRLEILRYNEPIDDEFQEQNLESFSGMSPDQAIPEDQPPTGGFTPGTSMETP